MKAPFFSVVIPLYNKEEHIYETLQSVIKQSFKDFEVIIVNDGSTDKSFEIAKSFNDPRLKFFEQKNQGVSVARNTGIEKSNADYIALLDADDIWYNNHLDITYKLIGDFAEAKVFSTSYVMAFNNHFKKAVFKNITNNYRGIVNNFFECNLYDAILNSSVVTIKKKALIKAGAFDTEIKSGQDTDLWIKLAIKNSVAFENTCTASIIKNKKSLSNSDLVGDRVKFLNKYLDHEKDNLYLKKYMDMNRFAIALDYKTKGKVPESLSVFKTIEPKNLTQKQKIIYHLPPIVLKPLHSLKQKLNYRGVFLHLYR